GKIDTSGSFAPEREGGMPAPRPTHVTILGLPEAVHSTVAGLADVFGIFGLLKELDRSGSPDPPFRVTIAGPRCTDPNPLPFRITRTIDQIECSDVVFVPALMVEASAWRPGRHPDAVEWLRRIHRRGATVCSTCSGALLLAETGLLDGREATTHWAYAEVCRRWCPSVHLRLEHLLVVAGERGELMMSGANGSWHDLALHLISQRIG